MTTSLTQSSSKQLRDFTFQYLIFADVRGWAEWLGHVNFFFLHVLYHQAMQRNGLGTGPMIIVACHDHGLGVSHGYVFFSRTNYWASPRVHRPAPPSHDVQIGVRGWEPILLSLPHHRRSHE